VCVHSGRAEQIRLALVESGIEWEDASLTGEEFGKGRADGTLKLAYGSVPALQVGDKWLVECNAILLYVAKVAGWHPADPMEAYNVENVLCAVGSLRDATVQHLPMFGATAADVEKFRTTVLPRRLKELSTVLAATTTGSPTTPPSLT
jgi:glutathione S-transferase